MASRTYGQYCGLAYALDLVGERWAMLIVRDLILGPKRFTDLSHGLEGVPSNILSARLKELEQNGIVERRLLPRPDGSVVYELTDYGRELEDVLLRLGRWGARALAEPRPGEALTAPALAAALQASFEASAARKLRATFELRLGEVVIHARVDRGRLEVGEGPLPDADLVLQTFRLVELLRGEFSPRAAIDHRVLNVTGDRGLVATFFEVFRLPPPRAAGAEAPAASSR